MKDELGKAIVVAAVVLAATAVGITYFAPYNQCVRAQTTINESGKVVIYPFPESTAKVQCAEALGGKPD